MLSICVRYMILRSGKACNLNMSEKDKVEGESEFSIPTKNTNMPEIVAFDPELGMNFSAWLVHFNQQTVENDVDDKWKFKNFQKFIRGSALKIYINQCLLCKSFSEVIEIFNEHFFTPVQSFADFQSIRFSGNTKDLYSYFSEKVELGRRINLSTEHIIEGLSMGLSQQIRVLISIKDPKTPVEWLQWVSKIIGDASGESEKCDFNTSVRQQDNRGQVPCYRNWVSRNQNNWVRPSCNAFDRQPQGRPQFVAQNERVNRGRGQTTHLSQEFPSSPCRFCERLGISNAYHWGQTCVNRPNVLRDELPMSESQVSREQIGGERQRINEI